MLGAFGQCPVDFRQRGEAVSPIAKPHVPHQDFDQALDDGLVLGMAGTCGHNRGVVVLAQLGVGRIQVGIVELTLEHALLETVRHRHRRHAAVGLVHPPVRGLPVLALHVLGGPGKQQLAETEAGDKHVGLVDLAGGQVDPLQRIASVVDLHALAGLELARGHRRLPVLRELAVKLLPEIGVRRQALRLFLPDQLQRVSQTQVVNHLRPVQLRHPQRIGRCRSLCRRGRFAIPYRAHRRARTAQRPGDLPHRAPGGQPPPDLVISLHRQSPRCHPIRPAQKARGYVSHAALQAAAAGGLHSGNQGSSPRKSGGPQPGNQVVPNSGNRVVPNRGNQVVPIRGNFAQKFRTPAHSA
jgi:hypothetical protein